MKTSNSHQWGYGYDDQASRRGLPIGSGLDPSPMQSTPRRESNGVSGNHALSHSAFGQSRPYLPSRPFNHTLPNYANGPPNSTYRTARSPSPVKVQASATSPTKYADADNSTIQRQRKELQSLINELKDRDRELNEMSDSHQKQLISWETDKRRVLVLEKKLPKLKANLLKRTEQVRELKERLRIAEHNAQSRTKELETTQMHLQQASDKANISSHQCEELKDRNENMANSIQELSTSLGQLQAKEQELNTTLKLKENELEDASTKVAELTKKAKSLQTSLQESRKNESVLKTERDQWKEQYQAVNDEVQKLRADISNHYSNEDGYQAELSQVKQDLLSTQKELFLAGEREKRKDQLIELSKSKQERTDNELQSLRQIYERQQKELMYLQHQIQDQDVLERMSDLNTDDDISELSVAVQPKLRPLDEGLSELGEYNLQDYEKGLNSQGLHQNKRQNLLAIGTYPPSRRGMAESRVKDLSPSDKGSYIDPNRKKVDVDDLEADRIQTLIDESRQMVKSLENLSPISSPTSTPERKDMRNRSTEGSYSTPGDKRFGSPKSHTYHVDSL